MGLIVRRDGVQKVDSLQCRSAVTIINLMVHLEGKKVAFACVVQFVIFFVFLIFIDQ